MFHNKGLCDVNYCVFSHPSYATCTMSRHSSFASFTCCSVSLYDCQMSVHILLWSVFWIPSLCWPSLLFRSYSMSFGQIWHRLLLFLSTLVLSLAVQRYTSVSLFIHSYIHKFLILHHYTIFSCFFFPIFTLTNLFNRADHSSR